MGGCAHAEGGSWGLHTRLHTRLLSILCTELQSRSAIWLCRVSVAHTMPIPCQSQTSPAASCMQATVEVRESAVSRGARAWLAGLCGVLMSARATVRTCVLMPIRVSGRKSGPVLVVTCVAALCPRREAMHRTDADSNGGSGVRPAPGARVLSVVSERHSAGGHSAGGPSRGRAGALSSQASRLPPERRGSPVHPSPPASPGPRPTPTTQKSWAPVRDAMISTD